MKTPAKARRRSVEAGFAVRAAFGFAAVTLTALLVGFAYDLCWGPLDVTGCLVLNVIVAFAGGFSTFFFGGTVRYGVRWHGQAVSAAGGVAIFLILYLNPPFHVRAKETTTTAPSIAIERVCGEAALSTILTGAPTCELEGTIKGVGVRTDVCAEFGPDLSAQNEEACAVAVGEHWFLGPLDLRAPGEVSSKKVELRVFIRDTRWLHRKLATAARTIIVPAPEASISSILGPSFCVSGTAANLRSDENLVIEATPLSTGSGAWYLPTDLNAGNWRACDEPDLRVPPAPQYAIAFWLGPTPLVQRRLSRLPQGYARLSSARVGAPVVSDSLPLNGTQRRPTP